MLAHIGQEIPEYQQVRDIFLHSTYSDDYSVKPGTIDPDAVVEYMTGHDFSESRVRSALDRIDASRKANKAKRQQSSLDAWF